MGRKTNVWIFQATNKWNIKPEDLDMAKKGTPYERETESLLIAVQNNAIRTNYVKAKWIRRNKIANVIYVVIKTKQSINHIKSKWSKLA